MTEIVQDNLSDYLVKAESSNGEVKSYRCRQVVIAADPVAAQQLVANLKLSSKDKQRLEIDLPKGRRSVSFSKR